MPPQPKKAAPVPAAGAGQPPWAMVSPDGTDLYFPTKPEDAQAFTREFGAQPVNPEGFPWPSILRADGTVDLGDADPKEQSESQPSDDAPVGMIGGQDSQPDTPGAAPESPRVPESEQGGPMDPAAEKTAPAPVRRPRRASQATAPAELTAYCPTPDYCFPLGLPDNVSHVACVHGSSS